LNSNQDGFLSKRSTLTNLLESISDWTISLENKFVNRVAYIDFSRAFDTVSHPKLLHKLKSYGIEDRIYQWSLTWQLQASSQKCCVIDVGKSTAADAEYPCRLGNEGLTTSENVRDLGVVVDSHLCFSKHIANIT